MEVRRDEKSEIEFYPNSNAYGREIVMSEDVRTDLTRLTNLVASKKHFTITMLTMYSTSEQVRT